MPEIVGHNTDLATILEMRPSHGLPRGVMHKLYEAARKKQKRPLGLLAAERLIKALKPGDSVAVVTGAGHAVWLPKGESDGPIGAVAIARALAKGLGVVPIFVGEPEYMEPIVATAYASGLSVMDYRLAKQRTMAAATYGYPQGEKEGKKAAADVLKTFKPKAVITIEKLGVNSKGISHSVLGKPTAGLSRLHHLVNQARDQKILTIGIGDGGNEIGFGTIAEEVRKIMPYGRKCQCPCGAGNADVTVTDVTVVGGTSNWGAYNIAACLALLRKEPDILHSPETEYRMVDACARAGAADGVFATTEMIVDGTPVEVQTGIIAILHTIVRNALREVPRPF